MIRVVFLTVRIMDATSQRTRLSRLIVPLLALLIAACAISPPVQEMSDARQAIRAAMEAQADKHAPDNLRDAERLMDEAARSLERGAYDDARRAALAARVQAAQARDAALTVKPGQ